MARGGKKLPGTPAGYGAQSVQVARSDQYGQGAASASAQRAVPLPNMAQGPQGLGGGGAPIMPGELPPLDAPDDRPWEPLTNGAPFGPGAGPDAMALPSPPDPGVERLDPEMIVTYLPQLEAVASMPGSSVQIRSLVRRLRMAVPPDFDPTGNV